MTCWFCMNKMPVISLKCLTPPPRTGGAVINLKSFSVGNGGGVPPHLHTSMGALPSFYLSNISLIYSVYIPDHNCHSSPMASQSLTLPHMSLALQDPYWLFPAEGVSIPSLWEAIQAMSLQLHCNQGVDFILQFLCSIQNNHEKDYSKKVRRSI